MATSISFVIATYNGSNLVRSCLSSITRQTQSDYEIVVVDNGSSDIAPTMKHCSEFGARCIALERNRGVGGAWNIGAQNSSGAVIIFINQDITLINDVGTVLQASLYSAHTLMVVGAKLYYPGKQTIQHAGGVILYPRCTTQHIGYQSIDDGKYDCPHKVDYVTGAVLGCSRKAYNCLAGFDERFTPAYYEDVDFCQRATMHGGQVVYVPDAHAEHLESTSLGKTSQTFLWYYTLNRLRYVAKHLTACMIFDDFYKAELAWLRGLTRPAQKLLMEVYEQFAGDNWGASPTQQVVQQLAVDLQN